MLGTHFLHRLPKTENIFRAFLHFKLQPQQPSQHAEKPSRQTACTPTPRKDRMDYARGPQGPRRSHLSAGWHLSTGQNPKGASMCKTPSDFGSGHHPSRSPRHLPTLSHNLLTETEVKVRVVAKVERWHLQNQFLLRTRENPSKHRSACPAT